MNIFGTSILAAVILLVSIQPPAKADNQFLKFSKIPGNCENDKPSKEAKFWFGGDTLAIGAEEQAATASIDLAKSEFGLYQVNRDPSLLTKSKARLSVALATLRKKLDERFEIADAALSAGRLSLASDGYREIIKTYIGAEYQAARDRAKIGIDDVRTKQSR